MCVLGEEVWVREEKPTCVRARVWCVLQAAGPAHGAEKATAAAGQRCAGGGARTDSQSLLGMCARSMVFMLRYSLPSFSRIVAYCEFASGHDVRLHRPVRLYLLRQKVCVAVFALNEQKRWLMTCQITSSCCMAPSAGASAPATSTSPPGCSPWTSFRLCGICECMHAETDGLRLSGHGQGENPVVQS